MQSEAVKPPHLAHWISAGRNGGRPQVTHGHTQRAVRRGSALPASRGQYTAGCLPAGLRKPVLGADSLLLCPILRWPEGQVAAMRLVTCLHAGAQCPILPCWEGSSWRFSSKQPAGRDRQQSTMREQHFLADNSRAK